MGWREIVVAGRPVQVPEEVSGEEIRNHAGLSGPGSRMLVMYGPDGPGSVVPAARRFKVQEGTRFEDLPVGEYGRCSV
jgi:hypothetical protein